MEVLPITAFHYGPYNVEGNHPEIKIGKLKCSGRKKAKVIEIQTRTSCADNDAKTDWNSDPIIQICQGKDSKCFFSFSFFSFFREISKTVFTEGFTVQIEIEPKQTIM